MHDNLTLRRLQRVSAQLFNRKLFPMRNTTGMVSFTFDDIAASAYRTGRSILERYNSAGTFYVCGGETSNGNSDDMHSMADLRSLVNGGHELGNHGFVHIDYTKINNCQILENINANRNFLTKVDPCLTDNSFAYPFGYVNSRVKRIVGAEFASARGVFTGINSGFMDTALLSAVRLFDATINEKKIEQWLEKTVAKTGWLIFFTHDVDTPATPIGCSPQTLEFAVRRAGEFGLKILPVKHALANAAFRPVVRQ